MSEEFRNEWRMYQHKRGVVMYNDHYDFGPARTEVRYAVSCNPEDATPHIFRRKDILPHQGGDPNELFVDIRCPRNVRFVGNLDDEDLDFRQWAHSTLPAERFFDLYEEVERSA